jgi:hypothetical protein
MKDLLQKDPLDAFHCPHLILLWILDTEFIRRLMVKLVTYTMSPYISCSLVRRHITALPCSFFRGHAIANAAVYVQVQRQNFDGFQSKERARTGS